MKTDELLELLPDNLHIARNSNAPNFDKYRLYNTTTKKYTKIGRESVRELLILTYDEIEKQRQEWKNI